MVADQLLKPIAAAEELDIERQLVRGCNLQLLINAAVVLLDSVDADEGQIGNFHRVMPLTVMMETSV